MVSRSYNNAVGRTLFIMMQFLFQDRGDVFFFLGPAVPSYACNIFPLQCGGFSSCTVFYKVRRRMVCVIIL